MSVFDISIVLSYLILCLAVGFYKSSKIKNIDEYALGNRNFSSLVIVSTLFATFFKYRSANAPAATLMAVSLALDRPPPR